jgi:hypothetical protein
MVEGGGSCIGVGGSHGSSGVVVQAERLLGLRRMKVGGARQSGREGGGHWVGGPESGEVGRAARASHNPRLEEWAGRLGLKRKEKGNPCEIDF